MLSTMLATLLLILTSFTRADFFISPADITDPTNNDPSKNPTYLTGNPYTFTWSTSAPAVNLTLYQYAEDYYVICRKFLPSQASSPAQL
jgi:hypothetical protein